MPRSKNMLRFYLFLALIFALIAFIVFCTFVSFSCYIYPLYFLDDIDPCYFIFIFIYNSDLDGNLRPTMRRYAGTAIIVGVRVSIFHWGCMFSLFPFLLLLLTGNRLRVRKSSYIRIHSLLYCKTTSLKNEFLLEYQNNTLIYYILTLKLIKIMSNYCMDHIKIGMHVRIWLYAFSWKSQILQKLFVSTTNISVIFLINKNLFIMVNISGKINCIIYFIIFLKKII